MTPESFAPRKTPFPPAQTPRSQLEVYRRLSKRAAVHVSPICLGALSIGDQWNDMMGSMDKAQSFELLDAYYNMGGNFIDTASNYQDESSEQFIGEWMEERGNRDELVVCTKYSNNFTLRPDGKPAKVTYFGNNIKSMHLSVEASLKKLRTSYIDILYVHWWDFETTVEEVMDGLHNLITSGKVLYLGISDSPAYVVADANRYAQSFGRTPFSVYQGQWSILNRSFERDIIPMARHYGMALLPFSVLGGGRLRTDAEEEERRNTGEKGRNVFGLAWERNENEVKVSRALEQVAKEVGASSITAVAIAYVMHKAPFVFPVIGGRKVSQLKANVEALSVSLTPEHILFLESAVPFDRGFPYSMIGDGSSLPMMAASHNLARQSEAPPIQARA